MNRLLLIGIVLFHLCAHAQNYGRYKYKLPSSVNKCERGPDSLITKTIYSNMIGGISKTTKQIYQYDDLNRIVEYRSFNDDMVKPFVSEQSYFRSFGTGFCDSNLTIDFNPIAIPYFTNVRLYNEDSILTSSISYSFNALTDSFELFGISNLSYHITPIYTTVYEVGWRGSNLDSTFQKSILHDNKLIWDSSWRLPNPTKDYMTEFHTYGGDTIVDYSLRYIYNDGIYILDIDSAVRITQRVGEWTITSTGWILRSESNDSGYNHKIIHQTVDTLWADQHQITYNYDKKLNKYIPYSRKEKQQQGTVEIEYRFHNGTWNLYSKVEEHYIDSDKKCLGSSKFSYFENDSLGLYEQKNWFYDGVTTSGVAPTQAAVLIPNPFSVSYPFNCESLIPGEPYTLKVFDLTGKMILDQVFYTNQTIEELNRLNGNQLYYFVITNEHNERVMTQKIFMQH